jgi:hypothetical protein
MKRKKTTEENIGRERKDVKQNTVDWLLYIDL